jgi:hypothetical protein
MVLDSAFLGRLRERHCGGPGGTAAMEELRGIGMRLDRAVKGEKLHRQLYAPGGPLDRAGLLSPGVAAVICDGRAGLCVPSPSPLASPRVLLVGLAMIALGLVPLPDEPITWPVLLRFAATP